MCEEVFPNPKTLINHLECKHQTKKISFACGKCDFKGATPRSVGSHLKYCKGPRVPKRFCCGECDFTSDHQNGVLVHKSVKHRESYATSLPAKSIFTWTDAELKSLAQKELVLQNEKGKYPNKSLQAFFKHRTVQAVGKIRQSDRYKTILREVKHSENTESENVITNEVEQTLDHKADSEKFLRNWLCQTTVHNNTIQKEIYEYVGDSLLREQDSWDQCKSNLSAIIKLRTVNKKRAKPRPKPWIYQARKQKQTKYKRKYERFKKVQSDLDANKSRTMKQILSDTYEYDDDKVEPNISDIEKVYRERVEHNTKTDTSRTSIGKVENDSTVYGEISVEEIVNVLNSTDKQTASGIDSWTLKHVHKIGSLNMKVIFNLWFLKGTPKSEKECRTILLHKGSDKELVTNWRPITIGNISTRLYAKIWDNRLRQKVKLDVRQKAFTPVDGCYENVKTIQQVIRTSQKKRRELNLLFLDLSKAFDTILHESIRMGLIRKGVPEDIQGVIFDLYRDAKTTISNGKGKTREININSGVKQGCPLSPLLFNIVMDELVDHLQTLNIGFTIENSKLCIMAFADDLVLVTDSYADMEVLINECEKFFDSKGLSVNAKKSLSFRSLPVKGKKSMKIIDAAHRLWKGVNLPSASYSKLMRYLGVELNPLGEIVLPLAEWESQFSRLAKAPLKPGQRVWAIREILTPRISYQLRLSDAGVTKVKKINQLTRKWFKKFLHLPEWTPNAWVYSKGGGNLADQMVRTAKSRSKANKKMIASTDEIAASVGRANEQATNELLKRAKLDDVELSKMTNIADKRRLEEIMKQKDGISLHTIATTDVTRRNLWNAKTVSGKSLVLAAKALSGTLPTKMNLHRGNCKPELIKCRRCKTANETTLHVLNECSYTKRHSMKRHNNICDKIAKDLKKNNENVVIWREKTLNVNRENFKPDITMQKGDELTIVEITIPYEKDERTLARREREKEEKYAILTPNNLNITGIGTTKIYGIAIGSCGTITASTVKKLKHLNIKSSAESLALTTLMSSCRLWDHFENGNE